MIKKKATTIQIFIAMDQIESIERYKDRDEFRNLRSHCPNANPIPLAELSLSENIVPNLRFFNSNNRLNFCCSLTTIIRQYFGPFIFFIILKQTVFKSYTLVYSANGFGMAMLG